MLGSLPTRAPPAVTTALPCHRVVIVGAGFGGLQCAKNLRSSGVSVTILDWNNYHLFQPLLYQVATGGLSPANIASPIRQILKRQKNCQVILAKATGIDPATQEVLLEDGRLPYDSLVIATGARHSYFGHPEWEAFAPGLKTVDDAREMRRRIFLAFEQAEREADKARRKALLTFVVVGGGPTGVELAGAIAEIAFRSMTGEFRAIVPCEATIVLIEAGDRLLPSFNEILSRRALTDLALLGVEVVCNARVTAITASEIVYTLRDSPVTLKTSTVLWGAGVAAAALTTAVGTTLGATLDRSGRLVVTADCSLPGHPAIFAIGDAAQYTPGSAAKPLPGVAQVAMQQGAYVGAVITARLVGKTLKPFIYKDLGSMATIGKRRAVAEIGSVRLTGTLAWLAWVFIHITRLVTLESRLVVFLQWIWYWLTWNRSARLVSHKPERIPDAPPPAS